MPVIAIVGDVHDERPRLEASLALLAGARPDVVLLTGDLGLDPPWLTPERQGLRQAHDASVRDVLAMTRRLTGVTPVFVPGNHDLPDPPSDVQGTNCDRGVVRCRDVSVAGMGGSGPAHHGFPYEWTDSRANAALERLLAPREPVDVLLCHAPPARTTLDRCHDGRHVGSEAIRGWIARARPRLFVCGHIHEAWGLAWLGDVPCLNAGSLGEPFGQRIVWSVDWGRNGPKRIESIRVTQGAEVSRQCWLE